MTYVQDILDEVKNGVDKMILFVAVGPSGSGKSHLCKELHARLNTQFPSSSTIHSLDDYRISCNGGIYPTTRSEHDKINQIAIPMYKEKVLADASKYVILDNTHLKWDPDWQLAIQKAKSDNMDIFSILPPVTEFSLFSNRSTHLSPGPEGDDVHLKMCARWSGNRMKHILNRRISTDVLDEMYPLAPDSFSVNKMFHVKWGLSGCLYVLDNYLGYIDRDLVLHSVKAGSMLKNLGKDSFFLQKDSLLHVTLIKPKSLLTDVLKQIAVKLSKSGDPPSIEYNGVNEISQDQGHNRVIYLSVTKKSQAEWKRRLDFSCSGILKKGSLSAFNPDGLHVTLGFTKSDIWNIDKTVMPRYPLSTQDFNSLPNEYVWKLKAPLTMGTLLREMEYATTFQKNLASENLPHNVIQVPEQLQSILGSLMCHPEVKCKWRNGTPSSSHISLLNVQVMPPRFRSDDECYKKSGKLMKQVPRGLTHVFETSISSQSGGKIRYVNSVFPTPKFFGDNDLEEDVEVISDNELKEYGNSDGMIVTEKANGEMFTFTVAESYKDARDAGDAGNKNHHLFLLVMGSKNNKFPFVISTDRVKEDIDKGIEEQLDREGKKGEFNEHTLESSVWTNNNLWAEMCWTFARQLSVMGKDLLTTFLHQLLKNNWTLCGEFESYLHPHLMAFPKGHRVVRFFAATSHNGIYECEKTPHMEMLNRLIILRDHYKMNVVDFYSTNDDLLTIKNRTRQQEWKEGVVVLMVKNGIVTERVKLKTMWYVIHRGFREKMRKMLMATKKSNPQTNTNITGRYVEKILMQTLKDKLDIFNIPMDENDPEVTPYVNYIKKVASYLERSKPNDVIPLFLYDYPSFIKKVGMME